MTGGSKKSEIDKKQKKKRKRSFCIVLMKIDCLFLPKDG